MASSPGRRTRTRSRVDKVRFVGDPVAAVAAVDEDTAERGARADRRRVRAARADLHHRGGARARTTSRSTRSRKRANISKHVAPRVRRRRRAARRGRRRPRGLVLLRRHHARADRAALRGRAVRRRRHADGLVGDAGPALRAPRAREGARAAALAHPRDPRRIGGAFGGKSDPFALEFCVAMLAMRTGRPVKSRSTARRSSTRTAAGTRCRCSYAPARRRTARSPPSTSRPESTAARTRSSASSPPTTPARS